MHPDHVRQIGPKAIWVFLWLWGNAKVTVRPLSGEVFEGRPFRLELIAEELDMSLRTVCRHVARLRDFGYVDTFREGPGGVSAAIHIWRPGQPSTDAMDGDGQEGQGARNAFDGADSTPARQNLGRQIKSANSGVFTDEVNKYAKVGRSFENEPDRTGRFTQDKSASSGISFSKNRESGVPPLNNPPYSEVDLKESSESTTNVVPFNKGRTRPAVAGAGGDQDRECRQASPASEELDRLLSTIPAHERPSRTKTLDRAFLDMSLHAMGLVFDNVHRKRKEKSNIANPQGWWATVLCDQAWECKKAMGRDAFHDVDP